MVKKIFAAGLVASFSLVAFTQSNAQDLSGIGVIAGDTAVVADNDGVAVDAGGTQVVANGSGVSVNAGGLVIDVKNENGMYLNLKGKIVLKVQDKGQAYYVHPKESSLFYLGRPNDAFSVMRQQGVGISEADLEKIQVGTVGVFGEDTDKDGLSDLMEEGLGTDKTKKDTDGDSYDDKAEVEGGFNAKGAGKQNIDQNFTKGQKGRIFIQTQKNGQAWYINPANNKRYYLGRPADAFAIMRALGLGITNNDFNNI